MQSLFHRLVIFFFLLPALSYAQITMPTSRIVFQRGNDNRASVPIQGNCPTSANSIQVKANALNGGNSKDWTTVGTTGEGVFMGNISLQGGWYSIQVRALANGSEVGNWSVDRVGVGEVFAIAGQSNIVGSHDARNLSATDDRVSTLGYGGLPDGQINENDLPKSFINASNNSWIGPKNAQLFWGELGDKLVAKLGVPVMFFGAAWGGTSSKNWRDAAVDGLFEQQTQGGYFRNNEPYRALGITMSYYIKRTGIRSVLWHQGESDPNTSQGDYYSNITQLINKTRQQTGMGRLSWMVCRATYFQGHTNPQVINAQNQLADGGNNCFAGPATDFMSGNQAWRFDDGHINDDNYPLFESLFNDIMNVDYFNNSQPSQPAYTPSITTGYIFPHELNGGSYVQVPYMATAPVRADNQYMVQLVDENGTFLADLGTGSPSGNNLITVQLPVWADGRVRVRVNSTAPARNGEVSEFFIIHKTGERASGNPVLNGAYAALNVVSGTPVTINLPANFSDPANLALTYSWQNLPAGLNGSGLNITGTPTGSARTVNATLTATNSAGNSVSTTITINIADAQVVVTPTPTTPTTPTAGTCGFTEGQFLFTFYGERIYAHFYNGILFAANESATSGFKPQLWVHDAGSGQGFDMSKVSCFATTDPRTGAPVVVVPVTPTPVTPVTPAPATPTANACGFTEGQFLFSFYGERIYAHIYNGILFAAYENPTSGFKPQIWVHDAGSGQGFDISKVSCFATTDPRIGAPVTVTPTPTPVTPAPVTPTPTTPTTPTAGTCGFTEGQFLFTFYGEQIYAHIYNGIVFAANENATSGFKPQIWVHDAGSGQGFDMSKVSCFATADPRTAPPIVVTPITPTPTPVTPVAPSASLMSPAGYVDISDCGRQYGWARDAAVANKTVNVQIYWDNTLVSTLPADQYRNDLAAAFGDNGKHGFSYNTPLSLQSAGTHQVKLQIEGAASAFHTASVNCANRARLASEPGPVGWGVYPNPVTDVLTLSVPAVYEAAPLALSLVNAGGKSVWVNERAASAGSRKLDLSELETGVYVLRVVVDNKMVATLKILKQ